MMALDMMTLVKSHGNPDALRHCLGFFLFFLLSPPFFCFVVYRTVDILFSHAS